jgi:hypothetical protein
MSRAPLLTIALALAALSSVAAAAERGVSDAALAQAARDAWLNQIERLRDKLETDARARFRAARGLRLAAVVAAAE